MTDNLTDLASARDLVADIPWHRGPRSWLESADGEVWLRVPFDIDDSTVEYRPVADYRTIAREFLKLTSPEAAVAFSVRWGALRTEALSTGTVTRLHGLPRTSYVRSSSMVADDTLGRGTLDERLRDVLGWASDARDLAHRVWNPGASQRDLTGPRNLIVGVLRSMGLQFAAGDTIRVQLVPRSLLHLVYMALYRGLAGTDSAVLCQGYPGYGCAERVRDYGGRGRPPVYCSERCAARSRNRRRGPRNAKVMPRQALPAHDHGH